MLENRNFTVPYSDIALGWDHSDHGNGPVDVVTGKGFRGQLNSNHCPGRILHCGYLYRVVNSIS
jgi:hypothetical protein